LISPIINTTALATLMRPLGRVLWSMGDYDVRVWRFNLLLHCLPGVLAFIGMWVLPETAKFLISVGDYDGAYKVLDRLCLKNRRQDLKSFGVTGVTQPRMGPRLSQSKRFVTRFSQDMKMIFGRSYLKPILQVTIILSAFTSV